MDLESKIRRKVENLKRFYMNLLIYGLVCFASLLVWLSMGGGPFWPIWIILGCGISAAMQAINLGQLPQLQEVLPFLSAEWEEGQIKKLMQEYSGADNLVKKKVQEQKEQDSHSQSRKKTQKTPSIDNEV